MAKKREQKGMTVWILVLSVLLVASFLLYYFLTEEGQKAERGLYISEAVSSNSGSLFDDEYGTPDWIELVNLSDKAINLAGYSIARIGDSGNAFTFSEAVIEPGGTLVIYACEKRADSKGQICTGFKLPKSGTTLELAAPSGSVIQTLLLPALQDGVSYGLTESGEYPPFIPCPPPTPQFRQNHRRFNQPRKRAEPFGSRKCLPYGQTGEHTWVELFNYGTEPVLLSQFLLRTTNSRRINAACRP